VRLEKVQPLRHNIRLWLDEEEETHRRTLWQRLIKAIKVDPIPNGRSFPHRVGKIWPSNYLKRAQVKDFRSLGPPQK
jgi:hypothetical protein